MPVILRNRKPPHPFQRRSVHLLTTNGSPEKENVVSNGNVGKESSFSPGPETLPPSELKRQLSEDSLTNDLKDCDTVGAVLKKYQTLPANLDIKSLPRFLGASAASLRAVFEPGLVGRVGRRRRSGSQAEKSGPAGATPTARKKVRQEEASAEAEIEF